MKALIIGLLLLAQAAVAYCALLLALVMFA